jgi:hypothetical protein
VSPNEPSLDELRADAAYRRSRLALYRAKMFAQRGATSATKLREMERAAEGAGERLRRAESARSQDPGPGSA